LTEAFAQSTGPQPPTTNRGLSDGDVTESPPSHKATVAGLENSAGCLVLCAQRSVLDGSFFSCRRRRIGWWTQGSTPFMSNASVPGLLYFPLNLLLSALSVTSQAVMSSPWGQLVCPSFSDLLVVCKFASELPKRQDHQRSPELNKNFEKLKMMPVTTWLSIV
jgi:hypothetical protein